MAAISVSRRAAAGIALIVAGALFLLSALLPIAGIPAPWFGALADLALAVGYMILAIGAVNSIAAKTSLFAAAVGWVLLALAGIGQGLPSVLVAAAVLVAALGGVVGAIVIVVGKEIADTPAIVFAVATVIGAVMLLVPLGVLTVVLFGAALIATGVLFRLKESRWRRRR